MLTCHGTRKHIIRDPRQSMTFNTSVILLSLPVNSNNVRVYFRRSLVSGLCLWGRSAGSFPEQWMVIEPITMFSGENNKNHLFIGGTLFSNHLLRILLHQANKITHTADKYWLKIFANHKVRQNFLTPSPSLRCKTT